MIKKIYSVYDKVAQTFSNPFTAINDGTAIRSFDQACRDPNSELQKSPNDYSLYMTGKFDDELGLITSNDPALIAQGKEPINA